MSTSSRLYQKLPWHQKMVINILKCGPMPKHIAFIMDGNRRFAEKNCIAKEAGVSHGFEKFERIMKWSMALGVKEITVYAFSIENFKRSKNELDFIFRLLLDKLNYFMTNLDYYREIGTKFNIIGNISLLPEELQIAVSKLMMASRDFKEIQFNIAISYTSREEIYSTIKMLVNGVENNEIDVQDIDETLFTKCLYTRDSPEIDLLLRTSGETRLSDFLLWQSTSSNLLFLQTLWPEISLWEILYEIARCQRSNLSSLTLANVNKNQKPTPAKTCEKTDTDRLSRIQTFLDKLTTQTEEKLKHILRLEKIDF